MPLLHWNVVIILRVAVEADYGEPVQEAATGHGMNVACHDMLHDGSRMCFQQIW